MTFEIIDQLCQECATHTYDNPDLINRLDQAAKLQRKKLLGDFNNEQRDQDKNLNDEDQPAEYIAITAHNKITYKTLEEEINEVLKKIQTDPHDLTNHLSAARLYLYQGSQEDAVHICEQGLESSSSMIISSSSSSFSTSNRILLQQQLDGIKAKLDRRVDFLKQCPHEVGLTIISYLDSAAAVQGVDVSRTWRYKFLDHSNVWKEFTLDGTGKQRKIAQLLGIKAKNIKALSIHGWPDKIKRHLTFTIKKNNFSNLRSLIITDTGDGNTDPNVNLSQSMYKALPLISKTLTRLVLSSQSAAYLSLDRILLICRNLKRLKLCVFSLDDSFSDNQSLRMAATSSFSDFTKSLLTHLEISCTCPAARRMIQSGLRETVEFMPELQQLIVSYHTRDHSDGQDIMDTIRHYCPKLKVLKTSLISGRCLENYDEIFKVEIQEDIDDDDDNEEIMGDATVNNSTAERADDSITTTARVFTLPITGTTTVAETITAPEVKVAQGIRYIDIHNLSTTVPLRTRLEASCDTLETLSLQLVNAVRTHVHPHYWQDSLCTVTMHQLTTFRLTSMNTYIYQKLGAIIQCFPVLETLILGDLPVLFNDNYHWANDNASLVNAITQLPNLKRIELISISALETVDFERLMEHFHTTTMASSIHKSLEILKISNCTGFGYKALLSAARIKSLKELSIRYYFPQGIGSPLFTEMFTNYLTYDPSRPQALSKLDLTYMKFTSIAIDNIITLCKRNEMVQKEVVLRSISGCSFEDTKLMEKELSPLYHDYGYSEYGTYSVSSVNTSRNFIFSEKKLSL